MNKTVQELIVDSGEVIKDQTTILNEIKHFYQNLYSDYNTINKVPTDYLKDCNYNTLTDLEKESIEGEISYDELARVVRQSKNNSSPGGSGFTNEFYKFFWKDLGHFLLRSLNYSYHSGQMSITQKRGIITCLPKPGKPRNLIKNWRPISLLNVSYKFASACIANRIKKFLDKIIHDDQKGFISGRFIGENTRLMYDIIYETEKQNIPGLILLIDFEKAFDTVSWSFIDKVLDVFNFGNSIKRWIKTFYYDSQSCVIQNGHMSSYFKLGRGCRQGDPLSPYVFLLCAEILGILIRNNKKLTGIKIFAEEFRISQYADDTSLFLDGRKSLIESLRILTLFYELSGLKMNIDKTKVIKIGALAGSQIQFCPEYNLRWEEGNFTVLGIDFNTNLNLMIELNYKKKIEEVKRLLASWKQRQLTLFGKITVLKALIIPKFNHLFLSLPNPDEKILKSLEKIFFNFIWNKSNDKIKRATMMQPYDMGGLNMTKISTFIDSLKISWVRRLITKKNSWAVFINNELKQLKMNILIVGPQVLDSLNKVCNPFWRDVFKAWSKYVTRSLESYENEDIIHQPIWYNPFLNFKFKQNWYDHGLRTLTDVIDENGQLYTFEKLKLIYEITGTFIEYNAFVKSLPRMWKESLKNQVIKKCPLPIQPKWVAFLLKYKKGCRHTYNLMHNYPHTSHLISCIPKWNSELNKVTDQEFWKNIFVIPLKATIETKLKEFQFKIIHRIIATKKFLFRIKLVDNDKCAFCGINTEDLIHLFFSCTYVKKLWDELRQWLLSLNEITTEWDASEILLGIIGEQSVINHLLIITKYYIYRSSITKTQLKFSNLKEYIKLYYKIEKQICLFRKSMDKFYGKWSSFVDVFENPRHN